MRAFAIGRRRRDAVDHGIGKGDVRANPAREFGIDEFREPATAFSVTWPLPGMLSQDITVNGATPAARRRFSPATIRPKAVFGASDILRVGDDVGMGGIEILRRRRDVIAALGDRQRDDADLGPGERVEHRGDIAGLDEIDHRAGDARTSVVSASCSTTVVSQSCSPSFSRIVHVGVAHAGADDRPIVVAAGVEQIVEIDRLMRAMKIADADMNDAGAADRRVDISERRRRRAGARAPPPTV